MTDQVGSRRTFLAAGALVGATAALAATSLVASSGQALAQEGGSLKAIRDRGELRIGVAPGEPWFYKDQRTGDWYGLGWGMGVAVAKELGVKPVPVETTWGNAVAGLQAGQFDVMFTMDATPQRALAVDFPVQPMFWYAQGVLLADGVTVANWEEMNKPEFRIAVVLGTAPDRDITVRLPKATIERFPSADETGAAFIAGRMDAISLFHPSLVMLQSKIKRGRIVLPLPQRESPSSAAVPNVADKSWRDWLGVCLGDFYATGQTQKIFEEYLAFRGIDPASTPAIMRERWKS